MSQTVKVGTTFRSIIADCNALFRVTKRVAPRVWEAICEDEDYRGTTKIFKEAEIVATVKMDDYLNESLKNRNEWYAGLKLGTTVHYRNSNDQYVRCRVVDGSESRHTNGHSLQPIALIGEWSSWDLPRRDNRGRINMGYHAQHIADKGTFLPDPGFIYESPNFTHRMGEQNPRTMQPIDLTLPAMTEDEVAKAKLWEAIDEISKVMSTGTDPETVLEQVRALVGDALSA